MDDGLTIYSCVYVLKCEDDCYYVGITRNLNMRMAQHWTGEGAKWTRLHKPISVVEVIYPATMESENATTQRYMELYGKEFVRGGAWCKI
jgi:predicted GIY-YIG superfamily endonuclease